MRQTEEPDFSFQDVQAAITLASLRNSADLTESWLLAYTTYR